MPRRDPLLITGHIDFEERPPDYPEPIRLKQSLNLYCDPPLKHDDVTVFIPADEFRSALVTAGADPSGLGAKRSFDFSTAIAFHNGAGTASPCRVHAALAFGGEFFSVTIRGSDLLGVGTPWTPPPEWRSHAKEDAWTIRSKMCQVRKNWEKPRSQTQASGFLMGQHRLGEILYHGIFGSRSNPPASGLVLITGATSSGKTQVMNSLIALYLCGIHRDSPALKRRPHIVVLGDPVETLLFDQGGDNTLEYLARTQNASATTRAFDFTPRLLGKDAASVEEALRDALRETPAVYVISELRTKEDIKAALEFAATGQLVVATAHSTSLVDAMAKLLSVFGAHTPSGRSALAQRLKAIVHIRPLDGDFGKNKGESLKAALPAMWVGDPVGARNFVADGLASLLPRGTSSFDPNVPTLGVKGLAYAAEYLRGQPDPSDVPLNSNEEVWFNNLLREAHKADMDR